MNPTTGKGIYTYNLVKNLLRIDPANEYLLYTNAISGDLAYFQNSHIRVIHKPSWRWHFSVIKDFTLKGGDVFFSPTSYIIPAFMPKKIACIMAVHDLVAFLHPQMHQTRAMIMEKLFLRMALARCKHVLVPSQNTKHDLVKIFRCPDKKVSVTPLGVSEDFFENPKIPLLEVKKKYGLPNEFVLTVSGLEPRKNVEKIVGAFGQIAGKFPHVKLVIVGGKGWKSDRIQKEIAQKKGLIIHIENCGPEELRAFYRLAKVFVYPSLYEGFGLPPLEAMASGCPVICSNTSSLPEVCGDAALLINPENQNELAEALQKLLADHNLQKSLHEKGLIQARKFVWQKTAEKTLAILRH